MARKLTGIGLCLLGLGLPQWVLAIEPLTCLLQPQSVTELGSRESGVVETVSVKRASWVEAGAPILTLDQGLLAIDRERQQVVVDSLARRLTKNEALVESQLIPGEELDELRTNLALARIDLERLEQMQARMVVRAPFSGYVSDVYVAPGELVADQPVAQLIDTRFLRAEMSVLDTDFRQIEPGDQLTFAFDLVMQTAEGTILEVGPAIDPESNTFRVTAEIDNSEGLLTSGMSCAVVNATDY